MEFEGEEPKAPTFIDKMGRQMRKHPLIPLGMAATVGSLSIAFKRMQQRDAVGYQRWLRARVLAQGLTIVAIVAAGVQEMGVGVLTGNARPATPPPSSPWETAEFGKRLKEAEEAHRIESGDPSAFTSATVEHTTPPETTSKPSDFSSQPPTSGSSWSSWLSWSKK